MKRRRFLAKAGLAATAGAAVVVNAPAVIAQPRVQWRMPTFFSPGADIALGIPQRFAQHVEEMSGGRFKIQVFAAGELMPAAGVFDACSQGTVEAYAAAAYYWPGKETATQWFTSVPFGMNPAGTYAWYYYGDGIKLWEETYAPFHLVPRPSASTGPQMMGWFRKKLNSTADLKGLKMRIPGLGGKVYAAFGTSVVLLPPGEIYTALERGVIDAGWAPTRT
jgi:TRAP-type mannitol/chloroaromatic compound transport system substrate-binding protein